MSNPAPLSLSFTSGKQLLVSNYQPRTQPTLPFTRLIIYLMTVRNVGSLLFTNAHMFQQHLGTYSRDVKLRESNIGEALANGKINILG